jgi:hypothetical protein
VLLFIIFYFSLFSIYFINSSWTALLVKGLVSNHFMVRSTFVVFGACECWFEMVGADIHSLVYPGGSWLGVHKSWERCHQLESERERQIEREIDREGLSRLRMFQHLIWPSHNRKRKKSMPVEGRTEQVTQLWFVTIMISHCSQFRCGNSVTDLWVIPFEIW